MLAFARSEKESSKRFFAGSKYESSKCEKGKKIYTWYRESSPRFLSSVEGEKKECDWVKWDNWGITCASSRLLKHIL